MKAKTKRHSGPPIRKMVLGKKVTVNLNAKRGFRISPHPNWRAQAVGKCAKEKDMASRKACFRARYPKP